MKKQILTLVLGVLALSATAQKTVWNIDNSHSSVKFSVAHLVISETEGNFKTFTSKMEASKADFTDATVNFSVDVKSINTDSEMRDGHLKSADFFDADKYPQMSFVSTSFVKKDAKNYVLTGNLTIKGVTKKVSFEVVYGGTAVDPYKNTKAGFTAKTIIDRTQYGLTWSKATEAGGLVVDNMVNIVLKLEFAKAA